MVMDGLGTLKSRETKGGIVLESGIKRGLGPLAFDTKDLEGSVKPEGRDCLKSMPTHDLLS